MTKPRSHKTVNILNLSFGVQSFINRSLKPIEQVFERFPIDNQEDDEMCETGYCMT